MRSNIPGTAARYVGTAASISAVLLSSLAPTLSSVAFAAPSDIAGTVHTLQTVDPTLPSLPSGASPKGTVGSILSKIFWGSGTEDGKIRTGYLDLGNVASWTIPFWNGNGFSSSVITQTGGNIGIGVPSPSAKLDVNGSIRSSALLNCSKVYTNVAGDLACGTDNVGVGLASFSVATPLTYNNTTGVFGITQSSTSSNGYLSSADWNTFNGKLAGNAAITAWTATKITYDAKGLVTAGTSLSAADIPNLDWSKITTGKPTTVGGYGITDAISTARTISTTAPLSGGGDLSANRTISISQANTTTSGYLSNTDWNTFNGKQPAITGAATTVTSANLTANRAIVSDTSGKIGTSAATSTELSYLTGATSNLQAQINTKLSAGSETDPQVGTNTTNYLSKWDGSALVTSTVFDNGNVGIGTASPGQKLDVSGWNIRSSGEIISTSGNSFRSVQGSYGTFDRNDGANWYLLFTASGSQYGGWNALRPIFSNLTTWDVGIAGSALYAQHGGNVGIGTTAPSTKLHVVGGARITGLANCAKILTDASGNMSCGTDATGIGLGNLSVSAPLTYNSTTGAFGITQATTSTNGYLSSADWNAFNSKLSSESDPQVGTNSTNYLSKWNGSALVTSTMFDNGNVGIGTAAPNAKLNVVGMTNLSRDNAAECCSTGNATLSLAENTNVTSKTASIQFHNSGVSEGYMRLAGSGTRRFQFGDNQGVTMGVQMSGNLQVDGTGNSYVSWNFGIGTSAPSEKLEVNGNVALTLSGTTPVYTLKNVATPIANYDAANKEYVDAKVAAAGGGTPSDSPYLEDGSYYSEGGDPYFCRLNILSGTSQRIVSVNQNKLCDTTNNLYCNAGNCNASSAILNDIKQNYQLITAKDDQSCSINDGQAYCWGYTGNGQKYLDLSMSSGNSSREGHTCVVVANGTVKCWGQGNYGQLGNGSSSASTIPVAATGINNAVRVYTSSSGYSTNYGRTCALLADKTVKCWGYHNQIWATYSPTTISGLSNVVDFSLSQNNNGGDGHWCAVISDGTVKCAGTGGNYQLGNGSATSTNWLSGVVTVTGITNAKRIFTMSNNMNDTYNRSCALLADKTVKCWGYLPGQGNTITPIAITGLTNVLDFSMSHGNSTQWYWCAVISDGTVKCAGSAAYGQLGNGATGDTNWVSGAVVATGVSNAVRIYTSNSPYSTNYGMSCALLSNGQVKCWGYLPSYWQTNSPVTITGLSNVVQFHMSQINHQAEGHWCAVISDGTVKCAGTGDYGQLGNGASNSTSWVSGAVVVANMNNAVRVITGNSGYSTNYGWTCAILSNGQTKCWGDGNSYGRLGNNTTWVFNSPQAVSSANGMYYNGIGAVTVDRTIPELKEGITAATSVAAGSYHACAVEGGSVRCWGFNPEGQLGNNSTNNSTVPVGVFGLATAKQIAAGYMHTCAILTDSTVKCWGLNTYGQLGNGSTTMSTTPVTVSGISTAVWISAGDNHTCVTLTDGTVKCWGANDKRQLWDPSAFYSATPVTVSGVASASRIASGDNHNCVTTTAGATYCWGRGNWGQLGNGSYEEFSVTPTLVSGISTAARVGAGWAHTCVTLADATLRCWGLNATSQQASTSYFSTNTVANLLGTQNILSIVGWGIHSCVISTDLGNLNCFWGNYHGQLGIGTTNNTANVALVTYPVNNSSDVTTYTTALCETKDSYNGNLGGTEGANAICQTQCGQWFKLVRASELANFSPSAISPTTYWVDTPQSSNCQSWTDGISGNGMVLSFLGYNSTYGIMNGLAITASACSGAKQLLCIRWVR